MRSRRYDEPRADIIQAVKLREREGAVRLCARHPAGRTGRFVRRARAEPDARLRQRGHHGIRVVHARLLDRAFGGRALREPYAAWMQGGVKLRQRPPRRDSCGAVDAAGGLPRKCVNGFRTLKAQDLAKIARVLTLFSAQNRAIIFIKCRAANGNAIRMIWRKHNARQERGRQAKAGRACGADDGGGKGVTAQITTRRRSSASACRPTTGGTEALHGVARAGTATMFPQPVAMASMFDEAVMQKIGDVGVATEARAKYNEAVNWLTATSQGADLLVAEHQPVPRSALGPRAGDVQRGPVPHAARLGVSYIRACRATAEVT